MDMQIFGLAQLLPPIAKAPAAYLADEDAYYANYDGGVLPGWLITLVAALHAPRRRPAEQPASIRATQMA